VNKKGLKHKLQNSSSASWWSYRKCLEEHYETSIIGVAVVIPVVANVTQTAGLTGTTKTLVDLLPLFIAIALILVVVGLY
jgi:hypothetical protein